MRLYYLKNPELRPETLSYEAGVRSCYFSSGAVFALGGFDGVHIGHAALLRHTAAAAQKNKLIPAVWTFDEAPGAMNSAALSTTEQRLRLFAECGIEIAVTESFSEIKNVSAESFVRDILVSFLGCRIAVCGYNFTFGSGGKSHSDDLIYMMRACGGSAESLPEVKLDKETVSSTRIREMLLSGRPDKAAALLGRPFTVEAEIIHGRHLGHTIGIPTCNQHIEDGIIIPKLGVYASTITAEGKTYRSVTNIGMRPTVKDLPGGDEIPVAETHIIDGDPGDLYGKHAVTALDYYLREEKKFGSLDELTAQMLQDIERRRSLGC